MAITISIVIHARSVLYFRVSTKWAPTSYKYGCNSTYRGCNPNYPLISEFTGAITPFASSNWDGPFAGPHYGKSCHVDCTFTVTNADSCLLAKLLIS